MPPAAAPTSVVTSQPAPTTGPIPGNGEGAKTSKQPSSATNGSAYTGAFRGIVVIAATSRRHKANVVTGDPGIFERIDSSFGLLA
jgi:hypothetical protein